MTLAHNPRLPASHHGRAQRRGENPKPSLYPDAPSRCKLGSEKECYSQPDVEGELRWVEVEKRRRVLRDTCTDYGTELHASVQSLSPTREFSDWHLPVTIYEWSAAISRCETPSNHERTLKGFNLPIAVNPIKPCRQSAIQPRDDPKFGKPTSWYCIVPERPLTSGPHPLNDTQRSMARYHTAKRSQ